MFAVSQIGGTLFAVHQGLPWWKAVLLAAAVTGFYVETSRGRPRPAVEAACTGAFGLLAGLWVVELGWWSVAPALGSASLPVVGRALERRSPR